MSEVRELAMNEVELQAYTVEERTWAAVAHASSIVGVLVSLATLGVGGLLFAFIPLGIYLLYRDRSKYVTYHAAQAVALQLVGSVGFLAAIVASLVAGVLAVIVVALLTVILIGLVLWPVLAVLALLVPLALVLFPFVLAGFSLVATVQTAGGEDYDFPYIGRWVSTWLDRHAEETPAV
jgi:uncharacterized Tic20 family protein